MLRLVGVAIHLGGGTAVPTTDFEGNGNVGGGVNADVVFSRDWKVGWHRCRNRQTIGPTIADTNGRWTGSGGLLGGSN